jgi:SEC-C motif
LRFTLLSRFEATSLRLDCEAHVVLCETYGMAEQSPSIPALPTEGTTSAERYLARLCRKSFLSMWSYPSVFREQGRRGGKGDGKELCDLLVVFENHIIIFSDKDCKFDDAAGLEVAWGRWYKKAVRDSARQVWGAERWIKNFPHLLFLDRQCTFPFPINFPDPSKAVFHRIVVAHDASRASKNVLGGSGSLIVQSDLVGDDHFHMPFFIGQVDPAKGYVHVLDDTTLRILMETLDTITDFTAYLEKKERFLTGQMTVHAVGEEELLAVYLSKMNSGSEHDFTLPTNQQFDHVSFGEGHWDEFISNPQRVAQAESNRISYSWDELIEKFAFHAMTGTQYFTSGRPLREQEPIFRFMAREGRTHRRMLAIALHEILGTTVNTAKNLAVRVVASSDPKTAPYYVFLFLKRKEGFTDKRYRDLRVRILTNYCKVVKLEFPDAIHIVGIASEAGLVKQRSEDMVYMDVTKWSGTDQANAQRIQDEFGFLKKTTKSRAYTSEYPIDQKGRVRKPPSPNSPCPCGSRKRYKRCHGKRVFG